MELSSDDEEEAPQLVKDSSDVVPLATANKLIPVTILTGYLGAGKSTLLNYVLTNNHGLRIAVVENEFSQGLGIEGAIVKNGVEGGSIENFFELNNGCICCTVKDDLVVTLEQLASHKDKFEYILIEATGLANPGKLVSIFWMDDAVDSSLQLDGVITVVDSLNMNKYLAEADTSVDFIAQIAYGDRILLNKTDLITEAQLAEVEQVVQNINPYAPMKKTTFAQVDPTWLLHTGSFSTGRATQIMETLKSSFQFVGGLQCVPCAVPVPSHAAITLHSIAIQIPGRLQYDLLAKALNAMLFEDGQEKSSMVIFRMKGVLCVADEPMVFILQSVHDIFDIHRSDVTVENEVSRIIVIGRDLNASSIENSLRRCLR